MVGRARRPRSPRPGAAADGRPRSRSPASSTGWSRSTRDGRSRAAREALERHRVGARRRLARQAARRGAAAWADACGSVPVAAFTITKLSWLHRSEPDAWARSRACASRTTGSPWKLDRRVRDRPRRRVGHRLLLRRGTTSTARPARDRRRRPRLATRLPRVLGPGRSRRHDERVRRERSSRRAPATTWRPRSALALRPGRRRDLARHVGHRVHGERDADRRPVGRGRRLRRRDRPLPAARVHAQRDQGHRRGRALARRRPRRARRARAGRRPPARTVSRVVPYFDGERTPNRPDASGTIAGLRSTSPRASSSRAPRSKVSCAGCSTGSTR